MVVTRPPCKSTDPRRKRSSLALVRVLYVDRAASRSCRVGGLRNCNLCFARKRLWHCLRQPVAARSQSPPTRNTSRGDARWGLAMKRSSKKSGFTGMDTRGSPRGAVEGWEGCAGETKTTELRKDGQRFPSEGCGSLRPWLTTPTPPAARRAHVVNSATPLEIDRLERRFRSTTSVGRS